VDGCKIKQSLFPVHDLEIEGNLMKSSNIPNEGEKITCLLLEIKALNRFVLNEYYPIGKIRAYY